MAEFKTISRDAVPKALERAERYRLLNEPAQAESVCRDVLAVEPENQTALVMMLLALTDQFSAGCPRCFDDALAVVPRLTDEYQRLYYSGIVWERRGQARAALGEGMPENEHVAYDWVRRAMDYYEVAEKIRPPANDDALLRWNSCVRLCERYGLRPEPDAVYEPVMGD